MSTRILLAALLIALVLLVLTAISHRRALRRDADLIGDHGLDLHLLGDDEYLEAMARRAARGGERAQAAETSQPEPDPWLAEMAERCRRIDRAEAGRVTHHANRIRTKGQAE